MQVTHKRPSSLPVGLVFCFLWGAIFLEGGCKHAVHPQLNSFHPYIEAYSTGRLSKKGTVQIILTQEVELSHSLNTALPAGILETQEGVKGQTVWSGARSLEFKPTENFAPGKTYHFRFNLGKILGVPDSLKTFYFLVHIIASDLEFSSEGLKSYRNQRGRMTYSGSFRTADAEQGGKIEKMVVPTLDGHPVKITWGHSEDEHLHHFILDSLIRLDHPLLLKIAWDGRPLGLPSTRSTTDTLPGIHQFKILAIRALQDSEQAVLVQFSDPVSKTQDLRGMVELSTINDLRYSLDGSELKLYSGLSLDGNYILSVQAGIKNIEEKPLGKLFSAALAMENRQPSVSLPGKGVILPSTGKLMVPFVAVNLKAVDVSIIKIYSGNIPQFLQTQNWQSTPSGDELRRIGKPISHQTIRLDENQTVNLHRKNRFFLDLDRLIRTEPGAIYRIVIAFRRSYALNYCVADGGKDPVQASNTPGDEVPSAYSGGVDSYESYWNYYDAGYNESGQYDWQKRDDPCYSAYYTTNRWAIRNILASNMGLIAKKGDHDKIWVSVQDLLTAHPLAAVHLDLLDYQQQVVATGTSDRQGQCELKASQKPFLLVASRGTERGYLKLGDENALSQSRFDIGGDEVQSGIKGFIYEERDVHRPGDSLYLSFILDDAQNKLPAGFPVQFELRNPGGQLVKQLSQNRSVDQFYLFKTNTGLDAQTGIWTATIKVGGNAFTHDIRVETIMPNRLKISLDFAGKKQLSMEDHPVGILKARWLFGGTANRLTAQVDLSLTTNGPVTFPKWKDYSFDDPAAPPYQETIRVFDQGLDSSGQAKFPIRLLPTAHPPGIMQANFSTKVFEPGGAFSIHQMAIPYIFYSSFVGIKVPKGDESSGGMLLTGKDHLLDLIRTDPRGIALEAESSMELNIYKLGWHWWWENKTGLETGFLQAKTTQLIKTVILPLHQGRGQYTLRVEDKNWGRYLVLVKDLKSGHSSGKIMYLNSADWMSRAMEDNPTEAAMLAFTLDKASYQVGDPVLIKIPSAAGGRCLISLESGTKILKSYWIDTKAGQTKFSFTATPEMAPNIYVNVTLLQGVKRSNDLPMRMYGVVPLQVENKATILKPKIEVAASLRPETTSNLTVFEADGREMTYTLSLVDEGLLDLTGFETPNPHTSFYARQALGVKSFDLYDEVLGAWGGTIERILSIGGDEAARKNKEAKNKKDEVNQVNRFKPVVLFLGPYHLAPGEKKIHKISIPSYIGALRVMVVAGHDKAYGRAEQSVQIKKPLMVLATLPRVLAPGERLNLPVSVFAMDPSIRRATVTIAPSGLYKITGPAVRTVEFSKPGDQLTNFGLQVLDKTGIADVKITTQSGREKANYSLQIAVRNPNPAITQVYPLTLSANLHGSIRYQSIGGREESGGTVEVSTIPSLNLKKRLAFLVEYPYGCAEQLTSSAFPQLYLSALTDLTARQKADVDYHVKSAIRRIQAFQASEGGINYWPGSGESDQWTTSYAGHFILESQKKGYAIPDGFISSWKRYQRNLALSWVPRKENFYGGDLIQAYRLYTLALAHSAELGAMNRLKEFKFLSSAARWRLAAAYAVSGNPAVGAQMIQGLPLVVPPYRQSKYTYGSSLRDQAMMLETLTLVGDKVKSTILLQSVANSLSLESWFSTQETAYSLVAIAGYCGTRPSESRIHFRYTVGSKTQEVKSSSYLFTFPVEYQSNFTNLTLENLTSGTLYVRLIEKGIPKSDQVPSFPSNPQKLRLHVQYTLINGDPKDPSTLAQGTDFVAKVTISNPTNGVYENLALSEIFPSGWEILHSRLADAQGPGVSSIPTYQDIRDDRVLTYFNLGTKPVTFFVFLNATYAGHFYAPGFFCEAMYDASIYAGTKGRFVEVIPSDKNP